MQFEAVNLLSSIVGKWANLRYDNYSKLDCEGYLRELWTNGIVNIGNCGLRIEKIADSIENIFETESFDKKTLMSINNALLIDGLHAYLMEPSVLEIIKGYLGHQARFDRLWCYRIPSSMQQKGLSGEWHHDRVGKRLKMFVLLHDVGMDDRPMQIVKGSHKVQQRKFGYRGSRLDVLGRSLDSNDISYVTGTKGDVIIFDTNSMHRADWSGGKGHRDVLSFEFADRNKGNILRKLNMPIGPTYTRMNRRIQISEVGLLDKKFISVKDEWIEYGVQTEQTTNSHDI